MVRGAEPIHPNGALQKSGRQRSRAEQERSLYRGTKLYREFASRGGHDAESGNRYRYHARGGYGDHGDVLPEQRHTVHGEAPAKRRGRRRLHPCGDGILTRYGGRADQGLGQDVRGL